MMIAWPLSAGLIAQQHPSNAEERQGASTVGKVNCSTSSCSFTVYNAFTRELNFEGTSTAIAAQRQLRDIKTQLVVVLVGNFATQHQGGNVAQFNHRLNGERCRSICSQSQSRLVFESR